jgi:hypothetical protein
MENKKYHTVRTILKIPYSQNNIQSQNVGTEANLNTAHFPGLVETLQ